MGMENMNFLIKALVESVILLCLLAVIMFLIGFIVESAIGLMEMIKE